MKFDESNFNYIVDGGAIDNDKRRGSSPPSISSDNWSRHCSSADKPPRCWHPTRRRSSSARCAGAWSACVLQYVVVVVVVVDVGVVYR